MDSAPRFNRHRGHSNKRFDPSRDQAGNSKGSRPPPGLRGREIGLWYAKQGRERRQQEQKKHGGTVHMNKNQLDNAREAIEASKVNGLQDDNCLTHDEKSSSGQDGVRQNKSFFHSNSYWCNKMQMDPEINLESRSSKQSASYKKVLEFRKTLPVYKFQKQLVELIEANQVVVITGETGCGKTTQIPQFVLDDAIGRGKGQNCRIVCTQPRRISAIAVAERVAFERNENCGEGNSCGYQIKLQARFPRPHASILYCTTGILIKRLQSDELLSTISHVVLDEIHERDMNSDFLIAIIKDIISKRQDMKVVLMSATLNAEIFSTYFDNCPMFHVPGFTYPVTEYLLEETLLMTRYIPSRSMFSDYHKLISRGGRRNKSSKDDNYVEDLVSLKETLKRQYSQDVCESICCMDAYLQKKIDHEFIVCIIKHIVHNLVLQRKSEYGAILVFLPGWEDIKQLNTLLTKDVFFQPDRYRIIPLHSMMPTAQQKDIFERPPSGITKIVIATNIAETSITIDDVVYVIDSGKIKIKDFEHDKNLSTLQPSWETRANAKQRSGRAGRVQNGYCFRLYSKMQENKMSDFIVPEILRTPLDQVCLQIKLLKLGRIQDFLSQVMESPSTDSINLSLTKLTALNALDHDENLTPLGYHLAQLPVDPQLGKMLLFGAIFSCLSPILTIAACLSFKDPFVIPLGKEKEADGERRRLACGENSDHLMFANVFKQWQLECERGYGAGQEFCWRHFVSPANLKMIKDMRVHFAQYLYDCNFLTSPNPSHSTANELSEDIKVIQAVVCSGLYPNVARILRPKHNQKPPTFYTKTERRVSLHPKSVNCNKLSCDYNHEWLCYYEKMKTVHVNLYDTSEVSPFALLFFGGDIKTFRDDEGVNRISVDDFITFKAESKISDTVKNLRKELDKMLEIKIKQPHWQWNDAQTSILHSIVDLIARS